MQVFEFYFNPKAQKDRFFEVSSLEPQKDSSQGNLYIIGELSHTLPQNSGLLQKFAKTISREYSLSPTVKSQDVFFRTLVKKANSFFAQELHTGNVDWLGNLHMALLYVKNSGKKTFVIFSRAGGVNLFMARGANVVNLTKNVQSSLHGAELFSSVVSLDAFAKDTIVVLTKDVCDAMVKENALSDFATLSDAKHFQGFLKKQEKALSRLSGIFFALLVDEFIPQAPSFSFLKRNMFSFTLPKFHVPVFRIKMPSFIRTNTFKQRVVMVATFCILLIGGFFTFQGERTALQKGAQTIVLQIQMIQKEANDALELNDTRSANILLQEAWKKASSHTDKQEPFRETFLVFKEKLEEQLLSINSIQDIEDPVTLVDIKEESVDLIPQNILLAQGNLYAFNPFSPKIFIFNIEKKKSNTISAPIAIRYGIPFGGSTLFFGESDTLLRVNSDAHIESFTLKDPSSFAGMAAFEMNLYAFNAQQGTISKYEDPLRNSGAPLIWMNNESSKKPTEAKSMAIDGNIWVLTQDNIVQRYFGGLWQEDIQPLVFPLLKNATMVKVFPGLPYLYILDPSESRVLLLTKTGDLVKQYHVNAQDSLSDFSVSKDGNTLYLLAGSRVFVVEHE